jgi:hypothetical protein
MFAIIQSDVPLADHDLSYHSCMWSSSCTTESTKLTFSYRPYWENEGWLTYTAPLSTSYLACLDLFPHQFPRPPADMPQSQSETLPRTLSSLQATSRRFRTEDENRGQMNMRSKMSQRNHRRHGQVTPPTTTLPLRAPTLRFPPIGIRTPILPSPSFRNCR